MSQIIEIMDTTLRDGEQTDGVSFSVFEKVQIARLLLEQLKVNRIEIASARVSPGEHDAVKEIFAWAKERELLDRVEILSFVDHHLSVDWLKEAGGRVINLLTKGSRKHCEFQLGKNLTQHLNDITKTIEIAVNNGIRVNIYLEDWSNGYLNSKDYVFEMMSHLVQLPIRRFLFPDTLGIMTPEEVYKGFSETLSLYPDIHIDFHGHNDYGLATANSLSAVRAGAKGIHAAVNGLGERAGNTPLECVVTALHDKLGKQTTIDEKSIMDASRLVETFSGKRVAANRPIVGRDVYTQTAGIHADGDKKNNLYVSALHPERFGRERVYALGKLAGRASVTNNLKQLGIELPREKEDLLLNRIKELGEQKKIITPDDLPFLLDDLFKTNGSQDSIKIDNFTITSSKKGSPVAEVEVRYHDKIYKKTAQGDGGYDAFMNALRLILGEISITIPLLIDYEIRIPPGGKTDALVEATITWSPGNEERDFRTTGVDSDQLVAAIKATEKMLNRIRRHVEG